MSFIVTLQAVVAVLLSLAILVQHRAAGLSTALGGTGETTVIQRRGAERVLFRATIVLSIVFFALTLLDWYI